MLSKHSCLSVTSSTHIECQACEENTCMQGVWRQEDPWHSLPNCPSLTGEFQAVASPCLNTNKQAIPKKQKQNQTKTKCSRGADLRLSFSFYRHVHTRTQTCMYTHIQEVKDKTCNRLANGTMQNSGVFKDEYVTISSTKNILF